MRNSIDIGECARRCDANKKCKSIEWSDSDKNCVLLTAVSTDGPKWKDYRFCSKIKGWHYSSIQVKYSRIQVNTICIRQFNTFLSFMHYHKEITCPEERKNETVYVPDTYNCTKYYVCSHGELVEKTCHTDDTTGITLWWDTRNETCTWPNDSDCQGILFLTYLKNIKYDDNEFLLYKLMQILD